MLFERGNYSNELLKELYQNLLLPRMIEEKMLLLLRQGRVSKWFSGIGQEAISIGAAMALQKEEWILPMHRNLGVFTTREVPLHKLFAQFQGKESGFSKGRERSFHFGTAEYKIWGMISHLGPQLAIADGLALGDILSKKEGATIVFTGEGGTSEGDFHEALNVASVWHLPVIFLIENNGYGLSTPTSEQYNCKDLIDRGIGYGMEAVQINGNNILETYSKLNELAEGIRKNPRPVLVEAITFRMRGHEEASGTKYVPKELMEQWALEDPLNNYEQYLISEKVISEEDIKAYRKRYSELINKELEIAFGAPDLTPTPESEIKDVYAPFDQKVINPSSDKKSPKRFIDAVSDGLRQSMQQYDNLILMGQDIAEYGGVFKITEGFLKEFGKERVRNTPLCESAILGTGLGLTAKGYKSMVEMQFADFVSSGFNQIVNNLAKIYYRWGMNADVVVRMPCGGGVGAGPFHSQSNEAWFFHTPGLKVVYPSNPYDAKGLIAAAIEDPNPVMYFEHKALYRSLTEEIPDDYYTVEIGKAKLVQEGEDISIITYGIGVQWAINAMKEQDFTADILDLRTLLPFNKDAILATVKKTGKAIILHEDTLTGGIGGEIAAFISEHCFQYLDGPVIRSAGMDTPVPFSKELEEQFMPKERFKKQLKDLVAY